MLHVNGKWLAQNLTGTQRYAEEMTKAIATSGRVRLTLHVPRGAEPPQWAASLGVEVRDAPVSGILFEQVYLPLRTAGKYLVNFAGPAPLLKRRQLVTMHDATPFRYRSTFRREFVLFYFVMYFVLSRTARHLVTVSNFSAGELAKVLRVPADRFIVAGCSADRLRAVRPVRPAVELPATFYIMVGTLAVHKNLQRPLESVAASGRSVVVIGVAGNDQVFRSAHSLDTRAIVPGRLSDSELVWLYEHSAGLIFPSEYEGFGLPPVEAQALGCPVISSDAASLPEVCGTAALFFDPRRPTTLLDRLDDLETIEGLDMQLRADGVRNASRFSWDRSARTVLDELSRSTRVRGVSSDAAESPSDGAGHR